MNYAYDICPRSHRLPLHDLPPHLQRITQRVIILLLFILFFLQSAQQMTPLTPHHRGRGATTATPRAQKTKSTRGQFSRARGAFWKLHLCANVFCREAKHPVSQTWVIEDARVLLNVSLTRENKCARAPQKNGLSAFSSPYLDPSISSSWCSLVGCRSLARTKFWRFQVSQLIVRFSAATLLTFLEAGASLLATGLWCFT